MMAFQKKHAQINDWTTGQAPNNGEVPQRKNLKQGNAKFRFTLWPKMCNLFKATKIEIQTQNLAYLSILVFIMLWDCH